MHELVRRAGDLPILMKLANGARGHALRSVESASCASVPKLQTAARGSLLAGVLFATAWLSCGCVPIPFTTSPGATGHIVDASTRTPVGGAEIVISRSTYPPESPESAFTNNRPPMVMSSDAGQFSVPLERRLDLYVVPVDAFPRFGLLVVRCKGYETTCVPFWSRSVADLGEIDVKPSHPAGGEK